MWHKPNAQRYESRQASLLNSNLWMSSRKDCPSVCAVVPLLERLVRHAPVYMTSLSVAVRNSYKHFCLRMWLNDMWYKLLLFEPTVTLTGIEAIMKPIASQAHWSDHDMMHP